MGFIWLGYKTSHVIFVALNAMHGKLYLVYIIIMHASRRFANQIVKHLKIFAIVNESRYKNHTVHILKDKSW
jgi:hypothetical protein